MPKRVVTSAVIRAVLKEKKRAPYLGVRPLSELLKKKYKVVLSKSAINKILTTSGLKEKSGRKNYRLIYRGRSLTHCGLFLLRCMDHQIGIFDYLGRELKSYFPKISRSLLEQLIILASFSALINEDLRKSVEKKGFLRLAGLGHFPVRKSDYFRRQLLQHKPVVELKPLKDALVRVSTVKFFFNNGYCGYFDAKMSTFWNGPCETEHFFLPLRAAVKLIGQMIEDKAIIIGYTKSFGCLSPLTFDFLKAVDKGVKKVELLDERGMILKELKANLPRVSFFIGYYPKILNKGVIPIGKPKRFKSFSWDGIGEFLCALSLSRFSQHQRKQKLVLNNVLIKQGSHLLPNWGLLTGSISSKRARIASFLKKYLYLWPNAEQSFIDDMKVIEKSFLTHPANRSCLVKMLPKRLVFKDLLDFARVGQILSIIFKETVWGWEPKGKEGDFVIGKDYFKINLRKVPREAKESFNKKRFYLDRKRVFIT